MRFWGIDLGTTNTKVARFDENTGNPVMVHMPSISRAAPENSDIEVLYSIPSCVLMSRKLSVIDTIGTLPFIQKRFFLGKTAKVGREALEKDGGVLLPHFARNWKPILGRDPYRTIARNGSISYSARYAAERFLRELLASLKAETGARPRRVVFSVPVDSYESYAAEVSAIARRLGISKVHIIDEPVAVALGYGLSVDRPKAVLIFDFGGGTLDLALVTINEKGAEEGRCRVIAKAGLALGGLLIDSWIVDEFCARKAYDFHSEAGDKNAAFWYSMMLIEAERLKEGLYTRERETFYVTPPPELQNFYARIFATTSAIDEPMDMTRDGLISLLAKRELYSTVSDELDKLISSASSLGVDEQGIDEVLLVGGSCLLPEVYGLIESRFGRDRVRAWQPFNAVAYGNATFASGRFNKSDFVIHDYAIVTYERSSGKPVYNIIVPRGTPFPTGKAFWKRQFTPICALGEPERIFKLVVCEIGERHTIAQEFIWDNMGMIHTLDAGDAKRLIIPLNDLNPVLGFLKPPHLPEEKNARLEISFMVNENRWLLVTVYDLRTRRNLLADAPVVRLR